MESVRSIGKFKYNSIESEDKTLEIFTEDFSKGTNYNKVLEIRILDNKEEVNFKCINIREYDDSLKVKYLYRAGSSRGTDITPTAKITDIDKTYSNKIIPAIKEGIEYINKDDLKEEKELLEKIYNILKEEKENISNQLKSIFDSTPKKERYYVLTVVIENEDKEIYIGDFEVFKNRIKEIPIKKFYYSATNNKEVLSKDSHCSICNNKGEVFGLASPFAFYTIDKPGYICGGFNYENAWKNYPVCKQCAIELELGKAYLDEHLTLSFYGRKFYLIPNVIYSNDLNKILKKYKSTFRKDKDKKAENMAKREDKIIEILSKEENNITFDLMFIEENNAALNILLNIKDVYPSTFKKIYETLEDIKNMNFFSHMDYLVNLGYLNILFNSKEYNKYFLDIVDKIIGKGKIEYKFLIPFINSKLKEAFIKEEKDEFVKGEDNYFTATLRAYTFIYYLYKLDKFKNKGIEGVEDMTFEMWKLEDFNSKEEVFEDYFNKNKAFFDTDSKKAVFMIGYLSKKLINLQATQEGGRKPFMSNLNGLNLTKKDLVRLLPKIQGKFMEYKKEYYNEELLYTSQYLINSNNLNDLSNLDIPLYFSLGMNMVKKFDLNTKEEEVDNDNE